MGCCQVYQIEASIPFAILSLKKGFSSENISPLYADNLNNYLF